MTHFRGKKIKSVSILVSCLIVLLFLFLDIVDPFFARNSLDLLEMKSLDFRFRLRDYFQYSHLKSDTEIVAIDEKSIKEIGRWPWSRTELGRLVTVISQGKPRVIGLDILLGEPETSPSLKILESIKSNSSQSSLPPDFLKSLDQIEMETNGDSQLARALEQTKNIVIPMALLVSTEYQAGKNQHSAESQDFLTSASFNVIKQASRSNIFTPITADEMIPPISLFSTKAKSIGHVYYQPDRDGVLRWEYLALRYQKDYYPSFGLQVAREALGLRSEEMKLNIGETVELGKMRIPTDERGRMLINYFGREGTIPMFSATDVLHNRIAPASFEGKILLIGTTGLGTYDLKVTPLSANMSGVEKNAMVVDNILQQRFLYRTDGMKFLDACFILIFGVFLWFILSKVSALKGLAAAGAMLIGYILIAQFLFQHFGLWINLLYPAATIALTYTSLTALRFMTEERQALEVRRMFSNYISPKMVVELVKDPNKAKLGGERREMTVLFSDLRGFTAFSEKHQPEEVVAVLNEYLQAMTEVVFHWDGTLDKFVGDSIMVFWGAPLDQRNHAELAIRCALHMKKRLGELQEKWRSEGKEILDTGFGINSGEMVVGNMGAEGKKMDYTVIGDNVNLAARVEALTRQYDVPILITESTYLSAREIVEREDLFPNERRARSAQIGHKERRKKRMKIGHVSFNGFEEVRVKGKNNPVRVIEVVALQPAQR